LLGIGVLVSGRGSNLDAILRAVRNGSIRGARVRVVVSSDPEAKALKVAERYGVPAVSVSTEKGRAEAEGEILRALESHGVLPESGLVLLAGYMKVLSSAFIAKYADRIMNIHPSLLPAFPGLRAQKQALDRGVRVSGCTVHFVVPEVDAGPIIIQRAVPVRGSDDEDSLSARILRQEHRAYPLAVRLFAEGRLRIEDRRVVVKA
jgi:phosphoribosylglycinamide formyltransferase 1